LIIDYFSYEIDVYQHSPHEIGKTVISLGKSAVNPMIDPSSALRACPELFEGTPVRAGPNGADRVLGDKECRVMEIYLKNAAFFDCRS